MIFGDLILCNLTTASGLNGMTVRQVLGIANSLLGGGSSNFTITEIVAQVQDLNAAFPDGTPSTFAQEHLRNGSCGWQDGDLTTYTQGSWGDASSAGGQSLTANYNAVYASTLGTLLVGLETGGFSMTFDSASNVATYLPTVGSPGALTANLVNPSSSPAGVFGGEAVSLKLNVDFSDAGVLPNTTGLRLGDLRLCNLAATPELDGIAIRDLLDLVNTSIGGGSTSTPLQQIYELALNVNLAFSNDPNAFAQQSIFSGACP